MKVDQDVASPRRPAITSGVISTNEEEAGSLRIGSEIEDGLTNDISRCESW